MYITDIRSWGDYNEQLPVAELENLEGMSRVLEPNCLLELNCEIVINLDRQIDSKEIHHCDEISHISDFLWDKSAFCLHTGEANPT